MSKAQELKDAAASRWWVLGIESDTCGPFDAPTLKRLESEGRISGFTYLCRVGSDQWQQAQSVAELQIATVSRSGDDGLKWVVPIDVPITAVLAFWCAMLGLLVWILGPVAIVLGVIGYRNSRGVNRLGVIRSITSIVLGTLETCAMAIPIVAIIVR